jgi:hypothetical protein
MTLLPLVLLDKHFRTHYLRTLIKVEQLLKIAIC